MIRVGDRIKVRVAGTASYELRERFAKVVYMHPSERWFMVEVKGALQPYRTCFFVNPNGEPDVIEKKAGKQRVVVVE